MTIYYNSEGSMVISEMVSGRYIDRSYQGYTKREAIAKFRKIIKEAKRYQLMPIGY